MFNITHVGNVTGMDLTPKVIEAELTDTSHNCSRYFRKGLISMLCSFKYGAEIAP